MADYNMANYIACINENIDNIAYLVNILIEIGSFNQKSHLKQQ